MHGCLPPPWGASMGASGGHKQPPQHVTTCTAALSHMHRCAQTCTAQLSCSRPRDLTVAKPPQNPHTYRKLTTRRYQKPEGGWTRLNYDLFRILLKLSRQHQHVYMQGPAVVCGRFRLFLLDATRRRDVRSRRLLKARHGLTPPQI